MIGLPRESPVNPPNTEIDYDKLAKSIVMHISYVKLAEEIIRATDFSTHQERKQNA